RTTHITRHLYEEPVSQSFNELRLTPRPLAGQRVRDVKIVLNPEPAGLHARKDYFGNEVTSFAIFQMHDVFTATATALVEVTPREAEAGSAVSWEEARELLVTQPDDACLEASEFVFDSKYVSAGRELADYARPSFIAGRPLLEALREFSH